MNWKVAFVLVACAAALVAQSPPVTILEIDLENVVTYVDDVADPAKKATAPTVSPLPSGFIVTFKLILNTADF